MKNIIYIKLKNEGTEVYRPISAVKLSENCYKISEDLLPEMIDEEWDFSPNDIVNVKNILLENQNILVADSLSSK